jgi:hypothetical protein
VAVAKAGEAAADNSTAGAAAGAGASATVPTAAGGVGLPQESPVRVMAALLEDHSLFGRHILASRVPGAPPGLLEALALRGTSTCVKYGSSRHGGTGVTVNLIPEPCYEM